MSNIKFFKLSFPKLIIPIILVLVVLAVFLSTVYLNNQINNYSCKLDNLQTSFINAKNSTNPNVEEINKAAGELILLNDEIKALTSSKKTMLIFYFSITSNRIIPKIDPIYPVDCALSPEKFCSFYMSQESYSCMKNLISFSSSLGSLINAKIPDYKPLNYLLLIINLIILIIIGYLISCIIAFIYHKIRGK